MGSLVGIAIAAAVMIGGTELLRELEFLKRIFGKISRRNSIACCLFGLAMIVVMVWKPRGFVGSREPSAFLHKRKMRVRRVYERRARLMVSEVQKNPSCNLAR